MTEAEIIKQFKSKMRALNWTSIENSISSGVPDYVVSSTGRRCWVEFKRLYGRDIILRPLQRNFIITEHKYGSDVLVAFWNDGPVIMLGSELIKREARARGGKLYYDVADVKALDWDDIYFILTE